MKAEELRIGNLIDTKGFHIKKKQGIYPYDPCWHKYVSMFEPIPLTLEWLEKFGYVPCSFQENHFRIVGHNIWQCNEIFLCNKNGVILKHVHQLQNLYYAINVKELTIKL